MRFAFLAALLLAPAAVLAQGAPAPEVETVRSQLGDWFIAGSRPREYQFALEPTEGALNGDSFVLRALPGAGTGHRDFGTLMQNHAHAEWRGKRVRLSARIKTDNVRWAQLWMRVDGDKSWGSPMLSFYNMDDRPIEGSTGWRTYQIVLDVPPSASVVAYGFFIAGGRGTAWMDGMNFEEVGNNVPVTKMGRPVVPEE